MFKGTIVLREEDVQAIQGKLILGKDKKGVIVFGLAGSRGDDMIWTSSKLAKKNLSDFIDDNGLEFLDVSRDEFGMNMELPEGWVAVGLSKNIRTGMTPKEYAAYVIDIANAITEDLSDDI